MRIARVLLTAPDRTLTAKQITDQGGGPNVARTAGKLLEAGMLDLREAPPRSSKGPGRQPEKAFHLPDGEVDAVTAAMAGQAAPAGQLAATQQLVHADAASLSALMEALDVSEMLAKASWFTLCDGQAQEYVIAFAGSDAVLCAQTLLAELQGAGLTARRSSVTRVAPGDVLALEAQIAAIASRKARMRSTG